MILGSLMSANVPAFKRAIDSRNRFGLLRYLEVGCAYGVTCIGISKYLDEVRKGPWQSVMLDKRDGGWAYNPDACKASDLFRSMLQCGADLNKASLGKMYLNDDGSDKFLPACPNTFDLVLIDGCHSKECCTKDFLMVEPLVNHGGFVFFHDSDPASQIPETQPHCNQPIGVRQALTDLGVFDDSLKGWSLIDDIQPTPEEVSRGCVVIQKHEYSQ